jgi:hypothetical protein
MNAVETVAPGTPAADLFHAASAALEILEGDGMSSFPGDTADDLRCALKRFALLLGIFDVTVRDAAGTHSFVTTGRSSMDVYMDTSGAHGDCPCSITVTPALTPALQIGLKRMAEAQARRKAQLAPQRFDFKKHAANDRD